MPSSVHFAAGRHVHDENIGRPALDCSAHLFLAADPADDMNVGRTVENASDALSLQKRTSRDDDARNRGPCVRSDRCSSRACTIRDYRIRAQESVRPRSARARVCNRFTLPGGKPNYLLGGSTGFGGPGTRGDWESARSEYRTRRADTRGVLTGVPRQ